MYEPPGSIEGAIKVLKQSNSLTVLLEARLAVGEEIAKYQQTLYEYRRTALIPKGKEFTELDRTINMNADTAHIEHDLIFLQKLDELLKDKFKILSQDNH